MDSFLTSFVEFWANLSGVKFLRIFWIFFIFEFTRYLLLDYIILVIYNIDRYFNRSSKQQAQDQLFIEKPLVSIIVPGKNEGQHFYRLTRTLAEQTYRNYELIVVDDGSDDNTALIGRDLERRGHIDKFFRNEIRGGKASGANLALRYARGKFIVHLDADTSLNNDALEKILTPFYYDYRVGGVGGNVKVRNRQESLATALQSIEYLKTITIGRVVTSYLGIYRIISGAYGAFRREALDRVEGYDIGPGLDGDITVKIRKIGYRIWFEPTAVGQTHAPTTFYKLLNQRLRWSKSLIRFRLRKHRDVYYPNQNFSFSNFLSFLENFVYNVILNLAWFAYFGDIMINFTAQLPYIALMNYLLYMGSNYFQLAAIGLFDGDYKEKFKLAFYVPLVPLYVGFYIRITRTVGYFQELFFKTSYDDPWNPPKTSQFAKEMRI